LIDIQDYCSAGLTHPLSLATNGGSFKCNLVRRVLGLSKAHVWYNPYAIGNVFAWLDNTAKLRVTMDLAL